MAYKQQVIQIMPKGLNLLPPGDAPDGAALALTGWWPGAIGKLQQAKGWVQRNDTDVTDAIHSISETQGRVYYAADDDLYQMGRGEPEPIDSGYDGWPLSLVGAGKYMWIMNRARQRKDDGINTYDWVSVETPNGTATVISVGAGSLLEGTYQYYVTFVNADGDESNPSPALTAIFALDNSVVIERPSATGTYTSWNLYRQSPGSASVYKVNIQPIPWATDEYTDYGDVEHEQTDEDLIGRGEVMEEDHDPPPAARVMADKTYNDRLVVANTAAHPNRVYFTRSGQYSFFPSGQFLDCGNDQGDPILHISCKPGYIVFYRQRSIWRLVGDFDDQNARMEPFVPDIGVVGMRAVAVSSQGDFFVGGREGLATGVYRCSDWAEKVSAKIEPVFQSFDLDEYELLSQPDAWTNETVVGCALGFCDEKLWFSYPGRPRDYSDPPGTNTQSFIYDVPTQRWFARRGGFQCFYAGSLAWYGGGIEGGVMALDQALTDNGNPMPMVFQSQYEDAGFPDREKTWADLIVNHHTQASTALKLTIRLNKLRTGGGVDEFDLVNFSSPTETRSVFPLKYPDNYVLPAKRGLPIRSLSLSVRIAGDGYGFTSIDTPLHLHYYLEARRGVTFDSGPTDHGYAGVKVVNEVEIDMDASDAPAALTIWTDKPGDVLTKRVDGHLISATNGRQIVSIVLDSKIEGKLLRYQVAGDDVQIYAFRAKIIPIGVYVDGSVSEVWESEAESMVSP